MKKFVVAALMLSLLLTGCGKKPAEDSKKAQEFTGQKVNQMQGYGEYSDKVDSSLSQVLAYYSYVQEAYDASDKKTLKTFVLDEKAQETLEKINQVNMENVASATADPELQTEGKDEVVVLSNLQDTVLSISRKVAERAVLMSSNENAENEKWFESLNQILTQAKDDFNAGTYLQEK